MVLNWIKAFAGAAALFTGSAAMAQPVNFEAQFDDMLGTEVRVPTTYKAVYETAFEQRISELAAPYNGRIGVAAVDLATGQELSILGDQRFPMASTSKIAIAATFLEGVDQGRFTLDERFPLLWPLRSAAFSSKVAPVKAGKSLPASELIELMITRSSNPATDALIAAVGGTEPVNDWMRRQGITEFSLDRDIATLVRDDGEFDPAQHIDERDSVTPKAMVRLLRDLYQGRLLSQKSTKVLLGAMDRTVTGRRRIPAMMPGEANVLHKTGSLNNTSSDVGIIESPDGRAIAVAIYVTGQGSRLNRERKIASVARALYDGFSAASNARRVWANADYPANDNDASGNGAIQADRKVGTLKADGVR